MQTSKKLLLVGFARVFFPGSMLQMFIALLLSLLLMTALIMTKPYRRKLDTFVAIATSAREIKANDNAHAVEICSRAEMSLASVVSP